MSDDSRPGVTSERAFVFGEGRISGYLSTLLGLCSLLGVLCFKFPELLATADLRANLDSFEFALGLLWGSIVVSFLLGKQPPDSFVRQFWHPFKPS